MRNAWRVAACLLGSFIAAGIGAGCQMKGFSGQRLGVEGLPPASHVRLAPDDAGDPALHHDFVLKQGSVESVFVWIPRFEAYQLLRPAAASHPGSPIGIWVRDRPVTGKQGHDWSPQTFGGFYVAKYEAGKTAEGLAFSQRGAIPWHDVTYPEAKAASDALLPGKSHLLRGDQWTALSVWSLTRGVSVQGNTWFGHDALDTQLQWEKPSQTGPSATGTGKKPDWLAQTNLTSHTGAPDGVFDLVGNVQEWDGALAMRGYGLEIDGASTGLGGTLPGYVATLHTDPELRRYGVAGTTQLAPNPALPQDFFTDFFHGGGLVPGGGHHSGAPSNAATPNLFRAARGGSFEKGHHDEPAQAGMWLLCLNRDDDFKASWMGFRPALSF